MTEALAIIGIADRLGAAEPHDLTTFDADFFGIPAQQAQRLAPQHRLCLETVWEALESASCTAELRGCRVGLYATVDPDDDYYSRRVGTCGSVSATDRETQSLTSSDLAPSWVSGVLALNGPAQQEPLHESLMFPALAAACTALRDGECDIAVAGVVNRRSLSDKACWSAGFLGLKRLGDARVGQHTIHALIVPAALNLTAHDVAKLDTVPLIQLESIASVPAMFEIVRATDGRSLKPQATSPKPSRSWQILCLSAHSEQALKAAATSLTAFLESHEEADVADVAFTLALGRRREIHRLSVQCRNNIEAVQALRSAKSQPTSRRSAKPPVVFLFPGAGAQYVRMAHDLYQSEIVFRNHVEECCRLLQAEDAVAVRSILFPDDLNKGTDQPLHVTLALFVVEYSLAQMWIRWGVQPESMIGHSVGEYAAACISEVFRLEDALKVVACRARLFETLRPGVMMSVSLSERDVHPYLGNDVSLAAINAPSHCVLSGSEESLRTLYKEFMRRKLETRLLRVNRAGHSSLVEPILDQFTEFIAGIELTQPRIPWISNYTGTWVTPSQALDPGYWSAHLRNTVRFSQGFEELLLSSDRVFIEVGPSRTLTALARQHPGASGRVILPSMRDLTDPQSDSEALLHALSGLWTSGVEINFAAYYVGERRLRIPLPTYPFQRKRYWFDAENRTNAGVQTPQITTSPAASLNTTITELTELLERGTFDELSMEELADALDEVTPQQRARTASSE